MRFALLLVSLLVAAPAAAFPIRVDVNVSEYSDLGSQLVGTGGFTFDSDFFLLQPSDPDRFVYRGLVPCDALLDSGVDFFAGDLAGTHWDILSPVSISYDSFRPIESGSVHLPSWDWDWLASVGGHYMGGDGLAYFYVDGRAYGASWTGYALGSDDPPGPALAAADLPEPPAWSLYFFGITTLSLMSLLRRCVTSSSRPRSVISAAL